MVSDRMIQSIYYSFLLVPLPVINLMLRQSDFPCDKCSTVDVIVTWNEVRIAFIVLYFVYYSHLHLLVLL